MKLATRLLALIGVIYLAAVAGLYLVQADRAADVEASTPSVTGTVVRLDTRNQTDVRDLFRQRSVAVPVIEFTMNGTRHRFVADTARGHYAVGDHVPLIYNPNDPADPSDDLVLIKGQDVGTLRVVAAGFAAAAVVAAWVFALTGLIQLRRHRDSSTRRRVTQTPGQELREVAGLPVASAAAHHEGSR